MATVHLVYTLSKTHRRSRVPRQMIKSFDPSLSLLQISSRCTILTKTMVNSLSFLQVGGITSPFETITSPSLNQFLPPSALEKVLSCLLEIAGTTIS